MSALILYDTTGQWGWLGELYAIMAANLVSRFGPYTTQPVSGYVAGQVNASTATIYIGSTYNELMPNAFLDDVLATTKPVIWLGANIWQLTARRSSDSFVFRNEYGWVWAGYDTSAVARVDYKGQQLKRYVSNQSGIMTYSMLSGAGAPQVLATAVRSDATSSTFPWAIRASSSPKSNLTYVGEVPFQYMTEGDRYLAFCDLLFDAFAPATPTTRRALLRIEDISPFDDPTPLFGIADYLFGLKVPFGFQIVPLFIDPNGFYNGGVPQTIRLRNTPNLLNAMAYMQQRGGTLLAHGYTHQYSNIANPYTAVSGDDAEFYRLTLNADQSVNYVGPVAEDSATWAAGRITSMNNEFAAAFRAAAFTSAGGVAALPTVWTAPNYAASAADYKLLSTRFSARSERCLYFKGLLSGGTPDPTRLAGQYFPYVVPKDVYGGKVLPDTLGGIEPQAFGVNPARLPADLIADGQRNLVIRDAWASFFFHASDWDTTTNLYLQKTVTGLRGLGYTFVSFNSV